MKASELKSLIREEIQKVLNEAANKFTEGDKVKVITPKSYNYYGSGKIGKIIEVAPSGLFYLVEFGDRSVAYYHESDLSLIK
jgi:ribosomal protein L21E